ncbi:uncharacterized protein LOC107486904 isoform X2 [Arachis duranensis]|uniref:Uncharacterized protein LOC107486904 isoform X2 n=1 Tax=Arachis duranensis TaxID=130453 RepID=A0A9C6TXP4_ARADU|nr:uncharacterized protein LOC107486904 isoform X2 [Arachis duranensis]
MSDSTSSCLAIAEKKAQKPGGCSGIFFQLFEWKRKLAKKKLFSKKLLPPARAKRFKGDEKMPNSKIHLIANENSGGFPSAKKGGNYGFEVIVPQKSEMRAPGLVARLMGLESIPASKRDKSKKGLHLDGFGDNEKECKSNCELDRQGMDSEIVVMKHDSRPEKLQKTGTDERRAVTRFGAEALQIKHVLARARKYHHHHHHHHHHPKLASQLMSPRIPSTKSASRSSRLIGAATRILEPGLQARSRAKGSLLTYHGSAFPPKTSNVTNCEGPSSAVMQNQLDYDASTAKPLMGQTSCKNCGNLVDVVDCKLDVPLPVVSDVFATTSVVSSQKNGRFFTPSPSPSHEQEREIVLLRSQEKLMSLATEKEGMDNVHQFCNKHITKRMTVPRDGPDIWNPSSQSVSTGEGDASSSTLKHKPQTQERMLSNERSSSASTMSNTGVKRMSSSTSSVNETKDFVALNRSLSGQVRIRSPTKVDSSKFDLEKKPSFSQNKSLSDVRTLETKRRTSNVMQGKSTAPCSAGVSQRNLRSDALVGKQKGFVASSWNCANIKSKQCSKEKTVKVNDNKTNEVVSFTFNSHLKQKTGIDSEKEEISNNIERKTCFQRPSPLRVDGLSAFLEQKLKELTSQEDYDLATGTPSKKSTAMILQELISALSSERLICCNGHMFDENFRFHNGPRQEGIFGASCNGNHHSPGSVLEASFSSSSLDESSGQGYHPYSMNNSYDQLEQLEHDAELTDSATTSSNKGRVVCELLIDLVNQIPGPLQSLYSFGPSLTRSKLTHMKDVILNAELVIGIDTVFGRDEAPELVIHRFLLDELDTMASDIMWRNFNLFVGCTDSRHQNKLKGFLFDCVIEYLESNCCRYLECGFKLWWTKLQQCLKSKVLAQEVKAEIERWGSMAGMEHDEIIEWEMSYSLGKWIDFDIETFEAGVMIDRCIFQSLLDEIVQDLVVGCKHQHCSSCNIYLPITNSHC